jgi:hypothetical protein
MSRKGFFFHFRINTTSSTDFYTEFVVQLYERPAQAYGRFMKVSALTFMKNRPFYVNAFAVQGQNSFSDYFASDPSLARARRGRRLRMRRSGVTATFFMDASELPWCAGCAISGNRAQGSSGGPARGACHLTRDERME